MGVRLYLTRKSKERRLAEPGSRLLQKRRDVRASREPQVLGVRFVAPPEELKLGIGWRVGRSQFEHATMGRPHHAGTSWVEADRVRCPKSNYAFELTAGRGCRVY